MKHLDLFSGIGGFSLASDWAFGDVEHIFCEIDPFCQRILKKHWPNSTIYGDIKKLANIGTVDLVTGGFPCQPFSAAGKRKGSDDSRHLWPEMRRVIEECKPRWVVGENVRGLLNIEGGVVFEQVCLDLEALGYEVQAFVIPACSVGAPHRRDRVWIVAHSHSWGIQRHEREGLEKGTAPCSSCSCPNSNASYSGLQGCEQRGSHCERGGTGAHGSVTELSSAWERNWLEIASELCGVDDGVSVELDGFKLSKAKHRIERLKSLGNAIVPAVAYQILKNL